MHWIRDRLNTYIPFDTCHDYKSMFEKMKDLAISLNQVTRWKHHLFFDAMDTKDEDLCEECNESMTVAFYVSNDRSDELKWRPHTGDCC